MKKILFLSFCCVFAFTILACEGEEVILFSQDDFVLRIDTLPYRGAVLFIDYNGELELTEYTLCVDIAVNGTVIQQDMPGEYADGNLIAEIIDLMYLPGDELGFVLKIKEEDNKIFECHHSEQLKRYPWKDWMLAEDEWFSIKHPFGIGDNFVYGSPSWNRDVAHTSWDIWTTSGKAVEVYCGTAGIVNRIPPACIEGNLEIYNPYVGAIVQYGHTTHVEHLFAGKNVFPGQHIANVIPVDKHIHYSVIRPYEYKYDGNDGHYPYYFPVIWYDSGEFIYDDEFYRDPFYWHEPTTLGYWNEETLPSGLKEEMLNIFEEYNPNVILPAISPLDAD